MRPSAAAQLRFIIPGFVFQWESSAHRPHRPHWPHRPHRPQQGDAGRWRSAGSAAGGGGWWGRGVREEASPWPAFGGEAV